MIDLLYTEDEELVRRSVHEMLSDRLDPAELVRVVDVDPAPLGRRLWQRLDSELGMARMHLPGDLGGGDASVREVAVVLEELGRTVAPVPLLGASVLAPTALLAAGADALLKEMDGESAHAALVVPVTTDPAAPVPDLVRIGSDGRLTGRVPAVVDVVDAARHVVVAVDDAGRTGLYAVAADDPGVQLTPHVSLDLTRGVTTVVYRGATVLAALAHGETATAALRAALTAGAGLLASEQLGIAEHCLDTTVRYLGERRQFGRVVGSYQALKHRLADLWVEIGGARAVARQAAALLATAGPRMEGWLDPGAELRREIDIAVALAQHQCAATAVRAAEEAVQLHGGIGMTWELPLHLHLKRAKADQLAFGSTGARLTRLAEAVDLPGPVLR